MTTLIFATHNPHKVAELRSVLPSTIFLITLTEAGYTEPIAEPYDTLEANAREKSRVIWEKTGLNCLSEDSGLEVDALAGAPGVHSARYAGEQATAAQNMQKLLAAMQHQSNRAARFRTVISLRWQGKEYFFEGICPGTITTAPAGEGGFGYDPVFVPNGAT
ncbi:MAG TPA: non-canonical purine NTP pyrophosphatase, partial [Phnomibacter sp.]|nr:non-canonical purine NTP pyrophosphatase [Phnomibacter sp.]